MTLQEFDMLIKYIDMKFEACLLGGTNDVAAQDKLKRKLRKSVKIRLNKEFGLLGEQNAKSGD